MNAWVERLPAIDEAELVKRQFKTILFYFALDYLNKDKLKDRCTVGIVADVPCWRADLLAMAG